MGILICTRGGSDIQNGAGTKDLWARPHPLAVRIMIGARYLETSFIIEKGGW